MRQNPPFVHPSFSALFYSFCICTAASFLYPSSTPSYYDYRLDLFCVLKRNITSTQRHKALYAQLSRNCTKFNKLSNVILYQEIENKASACKYTTHAGEISCWDMQILCTKLAFCLVNCVLMLLFHVYLYKTDFKIRQKTEFEKR